MYLQEKGRIPSNLKTLLEAEWQVETNDLVLADLTQDVVNAIVHVLRSVVPDMPDHIVAATALHLGLPVISRDSKIRLSKELSKNNFPTY